MKVDLRSHALFACIVFFSMITAACTDTTDPSPIPSPIPSASPTPTSAAVTFNLIRNGKPVVGMQAVVQNESDSSEIGVAKTSDASGKVTSNPFVGTARVTFVDSG